MCFLERQAVSEPGNPHFETKDGLELTFSPSNAEISLEFASLTAFRRGVVVCEREDLYCDFNLHPWNTSLDHSQPCRRSISTSS
jgi:hypothetical protein